MKELNITTEQRGSSKIQTEEREGHEQLNQKDHKKTDKTNTQNLSYETPSNHRPDACGVDGTIPVTSINYTPAEETEENAGIDAT